MMAESGKYSKSRMVSCIGHLDRTDVVYPLGNTECLCEVKKSDVSEIVSDFSAGNELYNHRFKSGVTVYGIFELLGSCQKIFLMKSRGGLGQWREKKNF